MTDATVVVQFSHVEPWLREMKDRPPNIEGIVRLNVVDKPIQFKQATGNIISSGYVDVFIKAGYLRVTGGVLQLVQVDHYVGQVMSSSVILPVGTPRPEQEISTNRKLAEASDFVKTTVNELGLEMVAGSYVVSWRPEMANA